MALQHRFQAGLDRREWWLAARVDGKDRGRTAIGPGHAWLAQRKGFFGTLQGGVARVLRWVGHGLLASPVLVLVYWVLMQVSPRVAGWLVVGFTSSVVLFFAALNAFIVLAMIRYVLSSQLTLKLWSDAPSDAQAAAKELFRDQKERPTVKTGEVLGIGAPADAGIVLRELVSRAQSVRVSESCDFALRTDDDEYVVVRIESAPLVLAKREPNTGLLLPEATRSALAERGIARPENERSLHTLLVRVGDRVTVTGSEDSPIVRIDRFELGGETRGIKHGNVPNAPYRGARGDTALLMRCTADAPMLIVREERA